MFDGTLSSKQGLPNMKSKRRINSTGRKRISRESIDIRMLSAVPGESLRASAAIDLSSYKFPADALLAIEAYHRSSGMRFECGTVGNQSIPPVLLLDQVDQSGSVLFRVKVTDGDGERGRLLGSAERVQPLSEDESKDRRALFPVLYRSLGQQVWKVEINEGDRPKLILNRDLPGIQHRLQTDVFMKGTLFPPAFRIVMEALSAAPNDDDGDDEAESPPWQTEWLTFCQERLGLAAPPPNDPDERQSWIEDAVDRFSAEYGFVREIRKQDRNQEEEA
ncbi:hypothetical protein [Bradyrhizobium sp. CER78]|uniref:hypothetical protein n=1 Tax=Bradyrhizobium sp. CER78 TaxID=3039162 RepID=UPI002446C6AE|nr:hypothetical protein [Bradyrhizobium sp. CER78]MDH2382843.1 hypothetical protein [Bradyrhizobium sp. CER78]